MAKYKCSNCGAIFNASKCPKCDTPKSACVNIKNQNANNKITYKQGSNSNLIICNDCGKEISKKSKQCVHCGAPVVQFEKDGKLKNSPLSIVAAVCSLFTFTFFLGIIIGLIDLGMNDKRYRHLGSWFAVIFGIIVGIVICMIYFNK